MNPQQLASTIGQRADFIQTTSPTTQHSPALKSKMVVPIMSIEAASGANCPKPKASVTSHDETKKTILDPAKPTKVTRIWANLDPGEQISTSSPSILLTY